MTSQTVISFLAILTLSSNILVLALLLRFLFTKITKNKNWFNTENFFRTNSLKLALLVSSVATLGSLYFSEVVGFEPCKLCWLQRIFMYPLPIILGTAIWNNLKSVFKYVLPLSVIGLAIAAYHYYYQITGNPLIPCSTVGFSVSCSERFFTYYGYITIPWMSLSAFVYIFLLGLVNRNSN